MGKVGGLATLAAMSENLKAPPGAAAVPGHAGRALVSRRRCLTAGASPGM
jgi:hypothetical protein